MITEIQKVKAMRELTDNVEDALLASILLYSTGESDRAVINEVAQILSPSDFTKAPYQGTVIDRGKIFDAMLTCKNAPHQINVGVELQRKGELNGLEIAFMSHVISQCPTHLDYLDYAKAVLECSQYRNPKRKSPVNTFEV